MSENPVPVITLSSGQTLRLLKVMLFEEASIMEVTQAKAKAAKQLGGSGIGFGVIGTPSWEFAADAAALGILSGVLTSIGQSAALESLRKAQLTLSAARSRGKFFDCETLQNISTPNPSAWVGEGDIEDQVVSIGHLSKSEKMAFYAKHGKVYDRTDGDHISVKMPVRYVSDGDEFTRAVTDCGEMRIRWTQVATYSL